MARYYADEYEYNPERRLLGSSVGSLANVLGGYLGAKIDQSKRERESRSVQALARSQGIDVNDPNFQEMDPRERRDFLEYNRLQRASITNQEQKQQQRQQEMASLVQEAQLHGIDPSLIQSLGPKEARSFITKTLQKRAREETFTEKRTAAKERLRQKRSDKAFQGYANDIIKAGGTYEDAMQNYGVYSVKQFRKRQELKSLPVDIQKIRENKKRFIKGKLTPVEQATLEGTIEGDIMRGKPISRQPNDPIATYFKQQALQQARKNIKFATWDPVKQAYHVSKLAYKAAESLGYIIQKPSKQDVYNSVQAQIERQEALQQEQALRAQQPGLLSRAGSAISGVVGGYQPQDVRTQQEQGTPMGQLETMLLRNILGG